MTTTIHKWGNSIAAPIPAPISRRLRLTAGTPITVSEEHGAVIIRPARKKGKLPPVSLAKLLAECKRNFPKGNPHGDVWGDPVGKEVW